MGRQWILVSETGGISSSLSYPLRTETQDFLYIGFQNLMDNWLLELNGGPDGQNDLSYRDTGNRRLESTEGQVYNLDGGDSTGEQDYNTIGTTPTLDSTASGAEIETAETPNESQPTIEESQTSRATNDNSPLETTQNEAPATDPPQVPPSDSTSSNYVDVYEGLVYHSMYEHLVTVDLRVKLYLRKNGISGDMDLDSVRRNLRNLQDTGEVELLAEVSPTIAFLEPVSEAKRQTKPSNEDVKAVFGSWMEYIFTKQRGLYMSTLLQYQDQPLLQEISTLRVDVSTVSASNSSNYGPGGAWSNRTQKVLMSFLIILGTVAIIWPMYAYRQYIKRREITLQLMNSEGADEYDFSGSFSSVTYKDAVDEALQLPPINPSVPPPPNSILPFPQALSKRGNSLDAIRHGSDVFPSKDRDLSQRSARSALEASDRYLSRHRPDLFYDQDSRSSSGKVSVFGRSYEIPSNPFEFIYKGQQQPQDLSTPTGSSDLGRNAHFPFASPRSSFSTPRASSTESTGFGFSVRSTSVGSLGSTGKPTHFTPIAEPNQNLAAGVRDDDEADHLFMSPGVAAHTGQSWQNSEMPPLQQPVPQLSPQGGVIGTIFRNLSISSWYNGNNIENSYTANSNTDPEFYSNPSSATEEVYYDDYHHQHQDSSLFQREIELESLPNDEDESPANYDFAFQDFPRKDGTPCLIIDDDSFLSERKRRESAKMIFNFDDEANTSTEDDGSLTEKKVDSNTPVSDESFKQLLSQNITEIDSSFIKLASSEELPPLESFLNKDPHDAKSPEFQSKLSRLMETKQQRYTRENKNAAIVAANRKKRKNVRERERVDRHKAIERELEDIEAEFSLTMQPQSPKRNTTSAGVGHHTPKRKLSPKPPTGGARYSPKPLRIPASPGRKNIATLSPARNSIAANSPSRSSMSRNRGIARTNSNSSRHRRQNSRGQSPYRTYNPRARHSRGDSLGSASLPMADFDGQATDYRPKMRPSATFDPIATGDPADFEDLSLPSMPFKSPQAVIDEALQTGASMQNPPRHYRKRSLTPTRTKSLQQRSLTPSRLPAHPRRTPSLDMNDDQRRMMRKTSGAKPNSNSNHRRARSGSIGPSHRRTSSRDEDMFLHGVVAQTRFI